MNCLAEAIGLALPGNGTILATSADRKSLYERAAQRIVAMAREFAKLGAGPRPARRARSPAPAAFDNAMILDMAMGGSTNTVLHILAIAHEAGVPFSLERIDELSKKTPNICKVSPSSTLPHRGRRPRRRHPHDPGRGRARLSRAARPVVPDRDRQDAGREHRRVRRPRRQTATAAARLLTDVRPGGERTSQAWTVPSVAAEARSQAAGLAVLEAEGEDRGDDADARQRQRGQTADDGGDGFDPFDVIRTVDNAYSADRRADDALRATSPPRARSSRRPGVSPKMLKHTGPGRDLRERDRRLQRHRLRQGQGGRRGRDPLRRAQGRARHAGDARPDHGDQGRRPGRQVCPDHRRPVLRRDRRRVDRPRQPRGGRRRPDRPARKTATSSRSISPTASSPSGSPTQELAARRAAWTPPKPKVTSGYLARYARMATSADTGAILKWD